MEKKSDEKEVKVDIATKFQAAMQKAEKDRLLLEKSFNYEERAYLLKEIVNQTINFLSSNDNRLTFDQIMDGVKVLIDDLSIDFRLSHAIFEEIQEFFRLLLNEARRTGNQEYIQRFNLWYLVFPSIPINYYRETIIKEYLSKKDLVDELFWVRNKLLEFQEHNYPFIYAALTELQKEIDEAIIRAKEKTALRSRIGILADKTLEVSVEQAELPNQELKTGYPFRYRTLIIEAAARLSETRDKWIELDLLEELDISGSTLDRWKAYFGLKMPIIRAEARQLVRQKESSQK